MSILQTIFNFFHINSGLDVEIVKTTFILSLIITLIVYHKRRNIPVGMIAPGVILLLLGYPSKFVLVLAISGLVYLTQKFLHKYILTRTILVQREKTLLCVLLSIIYSLIAFFIFKSTFNLLETGAVGIVLPAMIAISLTRANKFESIKSLIIASSTTIFSFIVIKLAAVTFSPDYYKNYLDILYPRINILDNISVLVMYVLFSVATIYNFILFRVAKLKSVGLLLGAYLGLLFFQPVQLLFVAIVTTMAYLIVAVINKHVMIYGYRILVLSSVVVSVVYSVIERVAFSLSQGTFHAFIGLYIAGILICSLIVSESIQYGYKKIATVSVLMAIILATTLQGMQFIGKYFRVDFKVASIVNKTYIAYGQKNRNESKKTLEKPTQYIEVAIYGDSQTTLARKAILQYEKKSGKAFVNYQRVFIETNLVKSHKKKHLNPGDMIKYSDKEIADLATESKKIDKISIAKWDSYKVSYKKS